MGMISVNCLSSPIFRLRIKFCAAYQLDFASSLWFDGSYPGSQADQNMLAWKSGSPESEIHLMQGRRSL